MSSSPACACCVCPTHGPAGHSADQSGYGADSPAVGRSGPARPGGIWNRWWRGWRAGGVGCRAR